MKKFDKIAGILFVAICFGILVTPFLFAQRGGQGSSAEENRTLAPAAQLVKDERLNLNFPREYDAWFSDHMGLRRQFINHSAWLDYYVFGKFPDSSIYEVGKTGDLNYIAEAIIRDYARVNLRSPKNLYDLENAYQKISDWVEAHGAQFYVVQCVDKHTICPEQFVSGVIQLGDKSKTDLVMEHLDENTTVKHLYLKETMLEAKKQYPVYSKWGDPTHWTDRGAFIGYQAIMEMINRYSGMSLPVLQEADYRIEIKDGGMTFYENVHKEDRMEFFTIAEPKAVRQDGLPNGFLEDYRHSTFLNEQAGNDLKLLIMGDSYINSYIVEDFAESFAQTWMVWGDYTEKLPEVVETLQPDIVIYECAERVDRSSAVIALSKNLP